MRLLVSVATADDARAAVEGGADIVDAKDPSKGPLGPVTMERLREIRDAVAGARPLTAALGEATDAVVVERDALAYAEAGATLVKLGLLGTTDAARAVSILSAAAQGVSGRGSGVVAVAYADADPSKTLSPSAVVDAAARAGAHGVLIDTMEKDGPGLLAVMTRDALTRWISAGRAAGLQVAVAGRLTAGDLDALTDLRPDIAGVRGAACLGGRGGRVAAWLVRELARGVSQLP